MNADIGRDRLPCCPAAINQDRNLRLQYLAGMGLNLYQADIIFDHMVASGIQFPELLFTGSPLLMGQLESSRVRS